jgi:hypothetical protein
VSEFREFMDAGLAESLEILGKTEFTIGEATFTGDLDQVVKERRELQEGGIAVIRSARLLATKAQFETKPDIGQRVTILGEALRIRSVAEDGGSYVLLLIEVDK